MSEGQVKKVEISEKELADLKSQLTNANVDAANAKAAEARTQKALEALRKKREPKPQTQPPTVSTEEKPAPNPLTPPDPHADHGHEEGKPHYIGAWQQFCPTCGDKNPDFKDETECEDCHTHLGSKEVAEKLKACPNCGGHRAKKL